MSDTQQLDFHCLSTAAHSRLLQKHSTRILQLSDRAAVRVLTRAETSALPPRADPTDLDVGAVQRRLRTRWLAHVLIHAVEVASTQNVLRAGAVDWPGKHGWVVTASRQSAGRGRRGSVWSSPHGSVAFTMALTLRTDETDRLVFLQYVAAMGVVEAARRLAWCRDDLAIKWPNDVHATDGGKVAGVLCEAAMNGRQDAFDVSVGVGVNVSNHAPTTCLYASRAAEGGGEGGGEGDEIEMREAFLAAFLTAFEELYDQFCTHGFEGRLLQSYLQTWMHTDQVVHMGSKDGPRAIVKGLAPNGWVRVFRTDWQAFQDLPPEDTSLDIVHNVVKKKPDE